MNLVIDNGSYSVKIGYGGDESPVHIPNCVARTKDKKFFIGDQIHTLRDVSQLQFKRPIEKGQLTSWNLEKKIWDQGFSSIFPKEMTDFTDTNLVLTETPFTLSALSTQTDQMIFEEFAFASYYRTTPAALIPWKYGPETGLNDFQLVIDSGYECTWVIPVIYGVIYWKGVKRLPIAGRFLNGALRELISFRHYNVTDETMLVNNIKEKTCFLAQDYNQTVEKIRTLRKASGRKFDTLNKEMDNMVLEYALPDFNTSTMGYVFDDDAKKKLSVEELEQAQTIKLYDERFSIPEILFHPEIVSVNKTGLIEVILESLRLCPDLARPLLTTNIVLTGGTFNIAGFQERLTNELRGFIPQEFDLKVSREAGDLSEVSWSAGCDLFEKGGFEKVAVTKQDYMEHGSNWCQHRFGVRF